jgi:hypothetical protein
VGIPTQFAHLPREHLGGAARHMVVDPSLSLEASYVAMSPTALLSLWLTCLTQLLRGA